MTDLPRIRRRLAAHRSLVVAPGQRTRQAAVAVILREVAMRTDILFIKRSERSGDPWSGQMAFPGGHREDSDASLRAAATRETLEEIGLDLASSEHLGALDHQRTAARKNRLDMLIAPHVFALEGDPGFRLNYEVAEVVWAPLAPLAGGSLHHVETLSIGGAPTAFNGYRLAKGHFVWGLTYQMLKGFFQVLDPNWTAPPELG